MIIEALASVAIFTAALIVTVVGGAFLITYWLTAIQAVALLLAVGSAWYGLERLQIALVRRYPWLGRRYL